jgi:Ser/Thr protein kinase RdoA (MazF antagonist)
MIYWENIAMLKLRYLFSNPDLALMLLKHWEYDEASLDLFQYYRISTNAIYPFRQNNQVCFLRFCPTTEKLKTNLLAELEFIRYLRGHGYPALEPLPSISGEFLIERPTPWGDTYASVFKRVAGQPLNETALDDEKLLAYGAALGRLHALSRAYAAPKIKRWTYMDVFNWIEEVLRGLATAKPPLIELELLRQYFSTLPIHPGVHGLIHYDFELDNVFYDEVTQTCSVIDFDDEVTAQEFPLKKAAFLRGYSSQFPLDETLLPAMPAFRRFANLYRYTRVVRARLECWENEPEWLVELRKKLESLLARDAEFFGKPIE